MRFTSDSKAVSGIVLCCKDLTVEDEFNPIDTEIFFDACVPGVCEKTHTPQNQFCFYKTTFFLHEVKFCINSALFLCTVLFSSSILMNFSDFGYKMTENSNFFENWATDKLCTSKESWNHLEIDLLAKK